ncbi:hypothetical protein SeLEV6574_g01749 [Synchytrium endobioticum]|uniref:RTR1-type domain-containing protein n=1 Tax=Synchytrium endobioticum TaxID=286115 RepID=A0A507DBD3_9FUNG|nr:hypothetical protein SeLEV6574_g01749 [Synchytrium endobioticum]
MTTPKFFTTNKKGENFELKADLNSEYKERRKETVKKVIANMTVGKDVSSLFADVVKNMQTEDLELKKLVYLYLINYAKTQPELVILAVNTFVKDSDDPNPLIRALSIRTMGCLRVEKIINYLMGPLQKALKDEDPYVRKTAAICVAKLFDMSPSTAIENGLIATLQEMLSDRNPMVIANAVAALAEISESSVRKDIFTINSGVLTKLLAALNECTEWGQICILTSLASYKPNDGKEAAEIVERVMARLQHANASVVLCAVKVLVVYMNEIQEDLQKQVVKKMAPPLVTLLSSEPELQYVALRNINLILQKRRDVLSQEMRVFFTKYNDPPYVKLEKLEVMIKLANEANVDQVLSELREYANEVDVDFVRKSVRAIGRCAIKIEPASERCVNVLLELIKTKVNYVVQEAVIVMKDIFRKYPHKYEAMIPSLCENLESLDEPEAKASLIWIIGEYADRIENADELLEGFLDTFKEENATVQLQLLTAAVKLFLRKPALAQDTVHKVLQVATQSVDNPDIRDRAFVYWRLLSTSPQAAKAVVLSEKPPIEDEPSISETLLDDLISNIATLASVYHKPSSQFGGTIIQIQTGRDEDAEVGEAGEEGGIPEELTGGTISGSARKNIVGDLIDLDFGGVEQNVASPVTVAPPGSISTAGSIGTSPRIGFIGAAVTSNVTPPMASKGGIDDLLGLMGDPTPASVGGLGGLGGLAQGDRIGQTGNLFGSNPASGPPLCVVGKMILSTIYSTKDVVANDHASSDRELPSERTEQFQTVPTPRRRMPSEQRNANVARRPAPKHSDNVQLPSNLASGIEEQRKWIRLIRQIEEELSTLTSIDATRVVELAKYLSPQHWEAVVEERGLDRLCGYPPCANATRTYSAKHVIRGTQIYDARELGAYCSVTCMKLSSWVASQLRTEPVWMRGDLTTIPPILVPPPTISPRDLAALILTGPPNPTPSDTSTRHTAAAAQIRQLDALVQSLSRHTPLVVAENPHPGPADTRRGVVEPGYDVLEGHALKRPGSTSASAHAAARAGGVRRNGLHTPAGPGSGDHGTPRASGRPTLAPMQTAPPMPVFTHLWTSLSRMITRATKAYVQGRAAPAAVVVASEETEMRMHIFAERMHQRLAVLRRASRMLVNVSDELTALVETMHLSRDDVVWKLPEETVLCCVLLHGVAYRLQSLYAESAPSNTSSVSLQQKNCSGLLDGVERIAMTSTILSYDEIRALADLFGPDDAT